MALLKTAREAVNYVRNPSNLVNKIWDELSALDVRVTNAAAGILTAGSVSTAELADAAVTTPKLGIFVSTEQTADGSAQNVAHGLGVSPATVLVIPSATLAGATAFTFTKGTTNVVVTGTNTAKYYVIAIV